MSAINEALNPRCCRGSPWPARTGVNCKSRPLPCARRNKPSACGGNGHAAASAIGRGKHGVFQDAKEACEAAQAGFFQLRQRGVAARRQGG